MKRLTMFSLFVFTFCISCKQKEYIVPPNGKATFSFSSATRGMGRKAENAAPAFVLFSIRDAKGRGQENIRLSLFSLGSGYLSGNFEMKTGNYQLTQFVILDADNKVIYATPLEGSDLAKYIIDPLPLEFVINENEDTRVNAQVLPVLEEDKPELFGMSNFGFEVVKIVARLHSEEYFTFDPTIGDFAASFKKIYKYDKGKLVQIDGYDYDPATNSYDRSFNDEEYYYDNKDKLVRKIVFVGGSGTKWIHEYEYLGNESIKVTRKEYHNDVSISQPDWWVMEKKPSSLTVKYYQLNNQLFAELNYEMDGKGNVISLERNPSFPGGKIYYKHDNSPNPYKFPELGGEYGTDTEKYLSLNNVMGQAHEPNPKSARVIEYNNEGYPVVITMPASFKRVLTYQ